MRWFLDTEFREDGRIIDLISIGLVSEDGQEYYAESKEFNESACSDWVKEHVLPQLGPRSQRVLRAVIRDDVQRLLLTSAFSPEIWAYYADYDWVVFCQLFGRMVDLPKGMPHLCRDLMQWALDLCVPREAFPVQASGEHNALADAKWNRELFFALRNQSGVLNIHDMRPAPRR